MTYVIDNSDGTNIPCMWTDCEKAGHEENKTVVHEGDRNIHYVFCTLRHKMYWVNSHRDMNNLPLGSKGLLL